MLKWWLVLALRLSGGLFCEGRDVVEQRSFMGILKVSVVKARASLHAFRDDPYFWIDDRQSVFPHWR
ncbi:hypothetical protein MTR_7g075680 [Medicago truncatula]|uniref:Transmembrane protein n=1 Tax=Medicago truncatula TaxID=3880 RepID=G7L1D6_MEDTR|nr:hypothetical protein MTR_7g075680 [Medicago truncatula]